MLVALQQKFGGVWDYTNANVIAIQDTQSARRMKRTMIVIAIFGERHAHFKGRTRVITHAFGYRHGLSVFLVVIGRLLFEAMSFNKTVMVQ
jgi:hypothetical protein